MKKHSTKIFQDIVNGLGAFIQSQFVSQQPTQPQQTGNNTTKVSVDLIKVRLRKLNSLIKIQYTLSFTVILSSGWTTFPHKIHN